MLRRSALSLALTLPFTTACASSHLVVQAKQPTLADRVDWVHDRPRPPERSLSLAPRDQELMTRYLEAVALGAARHRKPEDRERHAELSAEVARAWEDLRGHFRAALLADLEAGRFVAFRLRALPLARLALIQFEELEAEAVARGCSVVHDCGWVGLEVPGRAELYGLRSDLRFVLGRLLRDHSLNEIMRDDRHLARLTAGLTAALFVTQDGLPARDHALAGELLAARQRLLERRPLQSNYPAASWSEVARYEARRAEVAADEAETHRDRALDAALDASVAAEGVAAPPERPAPLRKRRVR